MSNKNARVIFIIRHGEKPADTPPPDGIDIDGKKDAHSLIPLGWQRAGALATLFAPFGGHLRSGLATPAQLISPQYGKDIPKHRTYETIYPLSQLIGVPTENPYAEGEEAKLGKKLAEATSGITLICWEHHAIPSIAGGIPLAAGTEIPQSWPDDRFDVVWSFVCDDGSAEYVFSQVPQMLLGGDLDTPIAP